MALDSNEKTPDVLGNEIDIDPADDLAYKEDRWQAPPEGKICGIVFCIFLGTSLSQ